MSHCGSETKNVQIKSLPCVRGGSRSLAEGLLIKVHYNTIPHRLRRSSLCTREPYNLHDSIINFSKLGLQKMQYYLL